MKITKFGVTATFPLRSLVITLIAAACTAAVFSLASICRDGVALDDVARIVHISRAVPFFLGLEALNMLLYKLWIGTTARAHGMEPIGAVMIGIFFLVLASVAENVLPVMLPYLLVAPIGLIIFAVRVFRHPIKDVVYTLTVSDPSLADIDPLFREIEDKAPPPAEPLRKWSPAQTLLRSHIRRPYLRLLLPLCGRAVRGRRCAVPAAALAAKLNGFKKIL